MTVGGLLSAIAADAPELLRLRKPELPQLLEAVILRCLEKDLARRYQSIAEVAVALESLVPPASRALIERIVRLSSGGASGSGQLPPSRGSLVPLAAFAATEKPWVTQDGPTNGSTIRRSSTNGIMFGIAAVAVTLLGIAVIVTTRPVQGPTRAASPPIETTLGLPPTPTVAVTAEVANTRIASSAAAQTVVAPAQGPPKMPMTRPRITPSPSALPSASPPPSA